MHLDRGTVKAAKGSREIAYPNELKNAQEKKKTFKQQVLKESPESLIADYSQIRETKTKTNLVFHMERLDAWDAAFSALSKRGISSGRQVTVYEDNDPDITIFTINIYKNGTVLIQGSENSLDIFEKLFTNLQQKVELNNESEANNRDTETLGKIENSTDNNNNLTPHLSESPEIRSLKECLSCLEAEFTEFRENILAKMAETNSTQLIRDEITK